MPKRFACVGLVLLLTAAAVETLRADDPKVFLVAPTEALTPAEQLKTFHLPPGYKIELVASEPALRKPMQLQFDAAGRMWVTQSIEYPYPVKDGRTPLDTVLCFTDTNGDGVPDKPHVFADGLNIPIGITPIHNGVLAYSIPNIDFFQDANNDGKADQRTPFYGQIGSRDTHGMASSFTWWLDGWVYATHGFNNDSAVKGSDGYEIKMNSGNTFRFKTDGSHVEQWTWGQVNPFGLTFDELGNMYSADCHSRPLYMLLRGAYYPSFGKPDDGLGFGPEMITHSHGSTGICGVAWYGAEQFPADQIGTMFICNPVTGRINHDRFDTHGSTYTAVELPDFLTCDDPWFRPVDVKLAPDGSLYVADFYNKIIGHYEVPLTHPQRDHERGRIWRITYVGDEKRPAGSVPDLTTQDLAGLIQSIGHPNIVVRTQATHQLVHRIGISALGPIRELLVNARDGEKGARQRTHGLWVAARLGGLDDVLSNKLATDSSQIVRTHLARCLGSQSELTSWQRKTLVALAQDKDAFVRRSAADALGLHPDKSQVPLLLAMWEQADKADTHLIHVVRMALRDTLRKLGTGGLPAEATHTSERRLHLAEICLGVRNADAAEFLLATVDQPDLKLNIDQQSLYLHDAVRYASDELLPKVLARAVTRSMLGVGEQVTVLRGVQRGLQERGGPIPSEIKSWQRDLAGRLLQGNEDSIRQGLEIAREFRVQDLTEQVHRLAEAAPQLPTRLQACECLGALDAGRAADVLKSLLLDGSLDNPTRQRSADLLAALNSPASREALSAGLLVTPSPVQLSIARGLAGSKEGGELLLKTLSEGKASPKLVQDQVVGEKLRGAGVPRLGERVAELTKDLPSDDDRLERLIGSRKRSFEKEPGDAQRGLAIFTKNCAGCHRLENKGTKVGPDLDGIGIRGVDRVLEDVLTPNRNVDQAFRATLLALKNGTTVDGLLQREEGEVLVLVNSQAKEVRVPKADVEEQRRMQLSPMPANLAEQLPVNEFHDLLAYLLSQRTAPVK